MSSDGAVPGFGLCTGIKFWFGPSVKYLAVKAVTSITYIYLLLLDMSKALDTVSRKNLLEDSKTYEPDELHIMSVLINDVKLKKQ